MREVGSYTCRRIRFVGSLRVVVRGMVACGASGSVCLMLEVGYVVLSCFVVVIN